MPSISFTQSEMQATREYWTPERIANARPAPLSYIEMPEGIQQKYDAISQAETEMAFCGAPKGSPYTHVEHTELPYKKAGRLYYTGHSDKRDMYATAQMVGGQDILMTAARCLKESGGKFSQKLMFSRGYSNGNQIRKMYVVIKTITTQPGWDADISYNDRVKWDYGFAKTLPGSSSGFFKLSLAIPSLLCAIGYPNNYGNKQRYMCYIEGKKQNLSEGRVVMLGNCMDIGATGGGWFSENFSNEIYGLNTGTDFMGNSCGPLFDAKVLKLLQDVKKKPSM